MGKVSWLPDWSNPLTLRIGLLLGLSGSMFFGLNAYMGSLLEQQGQFNKLADALFWFNIAQVFASLTMLKMAKAWVGRRSVIIITASLSILGTLGAITFTGWWAIASATVMSLSAGILLILLVAVPPLVTTARETGRLSAGTFLVGPRGQEIEVPVRPLHQLTAEPPVEGLEVVEGIDEVVIGCAVVAPNVPTAA